ncbi:Imm3 family immunity protein [Paenibacillus sp. NPDC058071]|uniref:Imm3 family immunity protein n=1 Tax=Paenibacillus sp. NPDC058071 TaxID=3346326 RepID=UPI0036DA6CED
MSFSYDEYSEYINETYMEFKNDEKMSSKEAIARTFNEYDMLMKKSETDRALISITVAEILVTHPKVLNTFKDYIMNEMSTLDFKLVMDENRLTSMEYASLTSRYENAINLLQTKLVDFYPRACWYYEELTDEVNVFFEQINNEKIDEDRILPQVLKRFEKECKNTWSEKIIVYTTIVENLAKIGYSQADELTVIKHELQIFKIDSIRNEQLTKEEIDRLGIRIKNAIVLLSKQNS